MSLTSIASHVFKPRQKALEKYVSEGENMQRSVLRRLIDNGRRTEYGVQHLLKQTEGYEDFTRNIPVNTYEEPEGIYRPYEARRG